jgi:threonine/homoserine/homoserine lactone efflux protein
VVTRTSLVSGRRAGLWAAAGVAASIGIYVLVCESLLWFGLVALVFSSTRVLAWIKGKLVWLDCAVGVVLMALAAKLAWGATR